tara:strand:- start:113 stop:514 length:402 start_codon:yes stop_codon:yes gene_type:complete
MHFLKTLFYTILSLFLIVILLWFGMPAIRKTIEPAKIISVVVKLDNKCTVVDDAFIVTVPGTDLQFPFKNGVVRLRLKSDRKLQLKANPKYKAIRYEGMYEEVKKNVTLVADCSSSPRLKGIFNSMQNQFKKE